MSALNSFDKMFFDMLELASSATPEQNASDKACFETALSNFVGSGKKQDAFTVYFCFSEIFKLFGTGYENTKLLLETLSDHEYHSGELLTKHRDHYSHSVYVFALGLAIYAGDARFRESYRRFYSLKDDKAAALDFLKHWGLVSLFHDIGYPFQLAHEQIKTYAEELWGKNLSNPFVSYGNIESFIALDEAQQQKINAVLKPSAPITNINALLAHGLMLRTGYDPATLKELLLDRVRMQPRFMDHGYFSAVILAKQLLSAPKFEFDLPILDVFSAILLHNSLNKYDIKGSHAIGLDEHPLSYLLMLCDELQCWDRLAYGKISKRAPLPHNVDIDISENRIDITYFFDSYYLPTSESDASPALNKNYVEMQSGEFARNIKSFINSTLELNVKTELLPKPKKASLNASDESFINLCDLAKAIHASYDEHCKALSAAHIETDFSALSLEFKVSNIEQAKSYGEKLALINCFYSSKDLDYPIVTDFNHLKYSKYKDNLDFLSREEHVRWVREKLALGWVYGDDYGSDRKLRDRLKHHNCIVPYDELPEDERSKDKLMIDNIIPLLKKFDSKIRVYNYRSGQKPDLHVAVTGHRFLNAPPDERQRLAAQIKSVLSSLNEEYRVTLHCCFAGGADMLAAQCAAQLGLPMRAHLPLPYARHLEDVKNDAQKHGYPFDADDELTIRHLLALCYKCDCVEGEDVYAAASSAALKGCDKLIALWDGEKTPLFDENGAPINRGGTYDTIRVAKSRGLTDEDIYIIPCSRA